MNQIWQDIPFRELLPYPPNFTIAAEDIDPSNLSGQASRIATLNILRKIYNQFVLDAIKRVKLSKEAWPSEVFFFLCDQLGIPVDMDHFMRIRQ